jgi:hypothetical protein
VLAARSSVLNLPFKAGPARVVAVQSRGVTSLDCHANFHSNGPSISHLTCDRRLRASNSTRLAYAQRIHGSKRSLRSVEDLTEFEQRAAYFNGDHVRARRKGVHPPTRADQVAMMAQMRNIIDLRSAPKLDPTGRLDPARERAGTRRRARVHGQGPLRRVLRTHDRLPGQRDARSQTRALLSGQVIAEQAIIPDGPIKTFTLRGIKDSPPYMHDGRLLTLADTVEFFNLVLGLNWTLAEKESLVAYMLTS